MKKRSHIARAAHWAVFATIAVCGPAQSADITFQALTGGSTRTDVIAKFPKVVAGVNMCNPGERTFKSAEGEGACATLQIPRYEVAGIPFTLSFVFRPGGTLWFAMLDTSWGHRWSLSPASRTLQEFKTAFDQIEGPLRAKYGNPILDPPCGLLNTESAQQFSRCVQWQAISGSRWQQNVDHIDIKADCRLMKNETGYSGELSVTYKFIDRIAASRL